MAVSRLSKALAALTFVSSAITSVAASSNSSICATSSKCVPFTIDVTWGETSSDIGAPRQAILTNGSIPGPPLKLKVGDCVDFTVINNLQNVTGVHFHGIRQYGTPWADGVPGVSQYTIQPGTSYMYQWTADESGNYFYHAHYKGQMGDGLYGAIIIAPADDAQTPFSQISSSSDDVTLMTKAALDVEPIFISDWSQYTFEEFFAIEQAANVDDACTDSIILNGKGSVYCPGIDVLTANAAVQVPLILGNTTLTEKGCIPPNNPTIQGSQYVQNLANLPDNAYYTCNPYTGANYTLTVDAADGWQAITLINPGAFALLKVTIDSHKLYVYEVNGNYIVPQVVDEVVVSNGDRYTFFVKLDQTAGDYQIRVANDGINQVISGYGLLSYSGGSSSLLGTSVINYGGQNTTTITAFDSAAGAPFPASSVAATADASFVLDIMKNPALPLDSWSWTLSGVEAYNQTRDDETPPLLYLDPASVPATDLILETYSNQWVDLIIKISGPVAEPHPIHKHANKFYMIGAGVGDFNFTSVAEAQAAGYVFNLDNPPYLDGYTSTPAEGSAAWMVFRYEVNTPGAWILHCHVQTHFSGGMAVAILDAIDDFPTIPSDVGKVCAGSGTSGFSGNSSDNGSWDDWSPSGSSGSGSSTSTVTGSTSTSTGTSSGSGSGVSVNWNSSSSTTTTPAVATYTGAAVAVAPSMYSALFGLSALALAVYVQ
ncbi:laccase TilA [Exophiala viscosa]|uniref:Laccase TilA n=1 Tax=Exophiala viscosa TaxID=2486360 RepID=A0AAN6IBC1_9EURO|nr:laccase TilA [Exophiala viscosa]